ncbi:MAG: cytochrome c [bacterium]
MPVYSENELAVDELDGILSWLGEAAQPADGPGLYTRYCGNCHGADARGGIVQVGLVGRPAGDISEKIREGEGGSNYGSRRGYMPRWTRAQISDAEAQLIWAAINGR